MEVEADTSGVWEHIKLICLLYNQTQITILVVQRIRVGWRENSENCQCIDVGFKIMWPDDIIWEMMTEIEMRGSRTAP